MLIILDNAHRDYLCLKILVHAMPLVKTRASVQADGLAAYLRRHKYFVCLNTGKVGTAFRRSGTPLIRFNQLSNQYHCSS